MIKLSDMDIDLQSLSDREKQAIVCMYFARFRSTEPEYEERKQYFKILSKRFNRKFTTFKPDKDAFDACYPDNGRVGWTNKPLEKRSKLLYDIYEQYGKLDLADHKKLVEAIMSNIDQEQKTFFSIRTKNPTSVNSILNKDTNIEIDGLNILKNELNLHQLVFIVLGGDKGKPEVTWETGLIGIGIISQAPYDEGYFKNNYKIKIDVKVLLDHPIKREDLVPYKDTYDIIGIGPITKWEPNQAISQMEEIKAVALMRAMLELSQAIEDDLSGVIDENLMMRVKGSTVKLIPQELDYGEIPKADPELEDEPPAGIDDFTDKYEPYIEGILEGFSIADKPVVSMKNFINTPKHIILTGPPGTGKTTIAEKACEEAVRTKYISGFTMTTAIADWSTFDTIGGYMPNKDGKLSFQEGIFLKAIRENKWLIIDEINRAEVDKAFGHFFTVLSGRDVDLQYKTETAGGSKYISIRHSDTLGSYYNDSDATYNIGRNWRIIATMNTYDKNSLFMLSYAFMRRFAFVHIPAPNDMNFQEIINKRLVGKEGAAEMIMQIAKTSPKKLGPAVVLDLINYLEAAGNEAIVEGVCSLVIPQYEGISMPQIKQLYKDLGEVFNPSDKDVLQHYLCEFFDISSAELLKVKFTESIGQVAESEE